MGSAMELTRSKDGLTHAPRATAKFGYHPSTESGCQHCELTRTELPNGGIWSKSVAKRAVRRAIPLSEPHFLHQGFLRTSTKVRSGGLLLGKTGAIVSVQPKKPFCPTTTASRLK